MTPFTPRSKPEPPSSLDEVELVDVPIEERPPQDRTTRNANRMSVLSQASTTLVSWIPIVNFWVAIVCVTVAAFLMILDTSILSTAIPTISAEFNNIDDIAWYATAFQLANACVLPLTSKIYTRFSTKWTFNFFLLIFMAGSYICRVAQTSGTLIAGRAVMGLGAGGIWNGGITIITAVTSPKRRASVIGCVIAFAQMGVGAGPLLGGVLTQFTEDSWRYCFKINLFIGMGMFFPVMFMQVPEQIDKPHPWKVVRNLHREFDLIGFALLAPAVFLFVWVLTTAQLNGPFSWTSGAILGSLCASVLLFGIWGYWNYRKGDNALLPVSTMTKRVVWASALTQWFIMTTVYCMSFFLPIFFQSVQGKTPTTSGLDLLPGFGAQLLFGIAGGFLVERTGYIIPYAVIAGILCSVSCGLMSTIEFGTHFGIIAVFQIINGAGRGFGTQMPTIAVQTANMHPIDTTIAITLVMFTQMLGTALVLAFANNIFAHSISMALERFLSPDEVDALIKNGTISLSGKPEDRQKLVQLEYLWKYVINAYIEGVHNVFYVAAGFGVLAVVSAFFLGWKDIRKTSMKKNWFGMSSDKEAANKLRKSAPPPPPCTPAKRDTMTTSTRFDASGDNFNENDNTPVANNTSPMIRPVPLSATTTKAERRVSRMSMMSMMSDAADFAEFNPTPPHNPTVTPSTKAERRLSRMSATAGLA
ncbi:major facilitator superfamily domain-containing protein [Sordaria brevicollis]|uniref:Major facilitator superfamily domain-containing protein n=1 Tax=Sordaria brevicollis TaxID=83679 RepID=A0AAE0PL16_SORBR|nr:major facilitator superfamily domain-containing protein [Sordaria brevicollis]